MLYTKELKIKESFDLVVCGGGFSGFAAAYSAAREGMNVLLVERNASLGGVGTNGLVNHLLGERYIEGDKIGTCVGGIFREIEEALIKNSGGVDFHTVDLALQQHLPGKSRKHLQKLM